MLAAHAASRLVAPHVDGDRLRVAVLVLSSAAALSVVATALL